MKKNKKDKKDQTKYNLSKKDQLLHNTTGGAFKTVANWYFDFVERTQKIRPKKLRKAQGIFFALTIGWGGWHKIYEGDFIMGITYGLITLLGGALLIFFNVQIKFFGVFYFFLPAMGVEVIALYDAMLIILGLNKKYK